MAEPLNIEPTPEQVAAAAERGPLSQTAPASLGPNS